MAGPSVRIEGFKELRRDLRQVDRSLNRTVSQGLREAMTPTAAKAAALAPHRTGRLARSLKPFATAKGAGVRSRLPYAPVIHWGWPKHHIKPSLFVTKAVKSEEETIVDRVGQAFDELASRSGFH